MTFLFQTKTVLANTKTSSLKTAQAFVRNRDGNISMLFGLSLLPMIAAFGSAIDYSRASTARTEVQNALDSAVLAVAKRAPTLTEAQIRREAETHFRSVLNLRADLGALPLTVVKGDKRLTLSASGVMETAFMKLFGFNTVAIATASEAAIGQRKVELALALDNTGSMSRLSKMDELKKATRNLIDAAEKSVLPGSGQIKIALVPFDTEVRVEPSTYKFQSWLAFKENARDRSFDDIRARMPERDKWQGCITDRGPGFDTNDKRAEMSRPDSLHPGVICANQTAGGVPLLASIQPLTDNWPALRAAVDRMQPAGFTNVTIGARFGIAALSPSDPIGGGVMFGTPDVDKYMVILTDGNNTRNRFGGSSAAIDAKTTAMCDDIKSKSSSVDAKGNPIPHVRIFTIRVIEGNRAMLRNCATNASMYKEVNDASQIDAVFKDILREITRLQLTS